MVARRASLFADLWTIASLSTKPLADGDDSDYLWIVNHIQIQSVSKTFEQPEILRRIITLTARVAAMGLLPKGRRIERLDEEAFHLVLESLQAGNLIGA